MKRKSLIFLTFFSLYQTAKSQTKATIIGNIIGKDNLGVLGASVSLLKPDSNFVINVQTDINGKFSLIGIKPGNYLLKISNIEYQTYKTPVFTLNADEEKTLPTVILKPFNKILNEVVVTSKTPIIVVKPDKIIFNVASNPSASGVNGLDLLKKAPGVKLDFDSNISLMGKSGVQIYINGVPSRLSGADLTAYLQSITSDNVEALEIISNPGVKYDAEGSGGIINFKTKKNIASGFNGNAISSFTKGIYYKFSNSLSLLYGTEKFKTNLDVTQTNNTDLEMFKDNKQLNNNSLDLNSHDRQIQKAYNISLGAEYQINKNQILNFSGQTVLGKRTSFLNSSTNIYEINPAQFNSILQSKSNVVAPSQNYNFNILHRWLLPKNANIVTALSLGKYNTDRHTRQPNTYFQPDGTSIISTNNTLFNAGTKINLWSGKIDYEKNFKRFNFTLGAKYAQVKTNNIFDFYNSALNNPLLDITKSNNFKYTENVAAAYSNINLKITESLKIDGGLRVETTNSRGLLISQTTVNNKDVLRWYTNFFPNFNINFDNQKNNSYTFSYGRRITRPSYQDLNPFETPTSELVIWKGNPFLNPNYSSNYQFTYAYKQKLVVSTNYTNTKGYFARIFEQTGGGSVKIVPNNLDNINQYGFSISYPQTITKFWDLQVLANASRKIYIGNLQNAVINFKINVWDFSIQNNFKLPSGILFNVVYFQQSDWIWRGSALIKGTHEVSFGFRKDFLNKKLQVRITGGDIFRTTSDYPYFGNYGGVLFDGIYTNDQRRFGAGITWKFGNQKVKKANKNNGLSDELNRI